MKLAEKTFELTLCSQLSLVTRSVDDPFDCQPLWFGLTQQQEARAGFDAATRLGRRRILLLQFKAGRRLARGGVRFNAPHAQLQALRARVRTQDRLVYYVLPEVTRTRDLSPSPGDGRGNGRDPWVLDSTWFLDVASIPHLQAPERRSGQHCITLHASKGIATITSDPVDVPVTRFTDLEGQELGGYYDDFYEFWSYAKHLGRGALAGASVDPSERFEDQPLLLRNAEGRG